MIADRRVDLLVVGGGAMGLATAWWAAPTGRVVLLERFELGHDRGASHGGERIFRHAYTNPAYVELVLAAEEGWRRLEHDAGRQLLRRVGCVEHGPSAELDALAQVAGRLGVATERMSDREAERRWPALRFEGDVLLQPAGGWVRAATAVECLATRAAAMGAELHFGAPVTAIDVDGDRVRVRTVDGLFVAPVAVVTVGAWTDHLLPGIGLPRLTTTEEHVFFFRPNVTATATARGDPVPSFIHYVDIVRYGLPAASGLVKLGEHHTGDVTTGDDRTFSTDPQHAARIERYVAEWLPGLTPRVVDSTTCLYTTTPSHDFVLDRVGPIVIGAGFSGHGFKFVPEIGRRLAAMANGEGGSLPPFALASHRTASE